jgi:hypothetical protein
LGHLLAIRATSKQNVDPARLLEGSSSLIKKVLPRKRVNLKKVIYLACNAMWPFSTFIAFSETLFTVAKHLWATFEGAATKHKSKQQKIVAALS